MEGEEELSPEALGRAVVRCGVDSAASVVKEEEEEMPPGMNWEMVGLDVEEAEAEEEEEEEAAAEAEREEAAALGGRVTLTVWPAGGRLMSRFGLGGPAVALRR